MPRRLPRTFLFLAAASAVQFGAISAFSQAKDADATKIADDALNNEYLAMDFEGAVQKLRKALDLCGAKKCSAPVVARLHRDLGVVYIAGLNDLGEGKAEFIAALTADPNLELNPDLATDAVTAAFAEVKASAGTTPGEGGAVEGVTDIAAIAGEGVPAEVPSSGTLLHLAPPEQLLLTPLPIYVELMSGTEIDALQMRYQPPTSRDWKLVHLPQRDLGYGIEIDCTDVGSTPGELRYYIEGVQGGKVIAFSGSKEIPHVVSIKATLDGEPPALPGAEPPVACESEVCPPGLPGCGEDVGGDCGSDEDCSVGLVCADSLCAKPAKVVKAKKHWVALAFQQDLMRFGKTPDVCSGGNEFTCYFAGGVEYKGLPDADNGNEINPGGFGVATQRLLLGYEYKLALGLGLGARLGFAFGGGPESDTHKFSPLHAEARVAYYQRLGALPLEPFAFLAGGLTEVDGKQTVSVTQRGSQCALPDGVLLEGSCESLAEDNPAAASGTTQPAFIIATNVDAWRHAGTAFIAVGAGARYLIKEKVGPYLELRLGRAFPDSATLVGAQLGVSLGF